MSKTVFNLTLYLDTFTWRDCCSLYFYNRHKSVNNNVCCHTLFKDYSIVLMHAIKKLRKSSKVCDCRLASLAVHFFLPSSTFEIVLSILLVDYISIS